MDYAECGVRSAECGKRGAWKMPSVENEELILIIFNSYIFSLKGCLIIS